MVDGEFRWWWMVMDGKNTWDMGKLPPPHILYRTWRIILILFGRYLEGVREQPDLWGTKTITMGLWKSLTNKSWDDPPSRHWRTFPKLVESKFLLLSIPGVLRWKEKNRWMHLPGWSPGWWPHTFGYGFDGSYDRSCLTHLAIRKKLSRTWISCNLNFLFLTWDVKNNPKTWTS